LAAGATRGDALDLVYQPVVEGMTWFSDRGSATATLHINV
jgi:hypothetical protein